MTLESATEFAILTMQKLLIDAFHSIVHCIVFVHVVLTVFETIMTQNTNYTIIQSTFQQTNM